jgi:hypothetical protein
MASQGSAGSSGPDPVESLTEDRTRMWTSFTTAITGAVAFVIVLLIALGYFLL